MSRACALAIAIAIGVGAGGCGDDPEAQPDRDPEGPLVTYERGGGVAGDSGAAGDEDLQFGPGRDHAGGGADPVDGGAAGAGVGQPARHQRRVSGAWRDRCGGDGRDIGVGDLGVGRRLVLGRPAQLT